ncbi:MAG: phage holin family protein [Bacteroidales bacterium]|nr:phage holin family protein [Bacteroidales bacterium]
MENVLIWLKWMAALAGGAITAALGGWDMMLQVLILFVVLDYATGLVAAWYEQKLDSRVGFRGIAKKVLIFAPIALAFALDRAMGQDILRSLAICFYVANEGLSVLENLGRASVPIPAPLRSALEQLKGKAEEKTD